MGENFCGVHKEVAGIDTSQLVETIVDFHHFKNRLSVFKTAVVEDISKRANQCFFEIDFL